MRAFAIMLVTALAAAGLAGCTASAEPRASNFSLEPQKMGWNVGADARFVLRVQPTFLSDHTNYTIDPDFAVAEIAFNQKGANVGGNYKTRNAADVDLRIWRNGETVPEALLGPGNEDVELTLVIPETLKDAEYTLDIQLFKVGWVTSERFRINVP